MVSTLPAQENGGSADELLSPLEITVEGQIEKAVINPDSATVYLPLPYYFDNSRTLFPISHSVVTSVKLQEGLTHTLPSELDLRHKTNFTISSVATGESRTWTIYGGYQIPGSDFSNGILKKCQALLQLEPLNAEKCRAVRNNHCGTTAIRLMRLLAAKNGPRTRSLCLTAPLPPADNTQHIRGDCQREFIYRKN